MISTDLQYFLEISTTLNISRSAERLGIAQSSLSMAVKRLEQAMKVPLLARHRKGIVLTPAGQQLLSQAKSCCRIGVIYRTKPGLLIMKCKDIYHRLSCLLGVTVSTESVADFSMDIGIVVNPFPHPDLIIRKLYEDKVTFWNNGKTPI